MLCRNCKQPMQKTKLNGGGYWRCMRCNEVAVFINEEPKPKHKGDNPVTRIIDKITGKKKTNNR